MAQITICLLSKNLPGGKAGQREEKKTVNRRFLAGQTRHANELGHGPNILNGLELCLVHMYKLD